MSAPAPTYDLLVLLDPQAQADARAKILADAREAITGKAQLLRDDAWGEKALAYPLKRKSTAEYHLLQFKTDDPALLEQLHRTLRITDGVLRFRIVKLAPGTPEAPDMRPSGASAKHAEPAAHAPAEVPAGESA